MKVSFVRPILTYGSESWPFRRKVENMPRIFGMRILITPSGQKECSWPTMNTKHQATALNLPADRRNILDPQWTRSTRLRLHHPSSGQKEYPWPLMNTKHQATAASSFQRTEGISLTLNEHEAPGYSSHPSSGQKEYPWPSMNTKHQTTALILPADRRNILDPQWTRSTRLLTDQCIFSEVVKQLLYNWRSFFCFL
jgi:hypothetical protein